MILAQVSEAVSQLPTNAKDAESWLQLISNYGLPLVLLFMLFVAGCAFGLGFLYLLRWSIQTYFGPATLMVATKHVEFLDNMTGLVGLAVSNTTETKELLVELSERFHERGRSDIELAKAIEAVASDERQATVKRYCEEARKLLENSLLAPARKASAA